MSRPFSQKAIWIWQIEAICGNDPGKITQRLVDAGFEAVYLHSVYLSNWRAPARVALAKCLQAAGLKVYASSGVYGEAPATEGHQAGAIVNEFDLDGMVFDAETSFDNKPTPDSNAVHLLTAYKGLTAKPCAWCWWSHYKSSSGAAWHPVKVLEAAMQHADVGMPMAYPNWGDKAEQYVSFLETTWQQWREVTKKPIVAAGRAYIGNGGTPTRENTLAYEQAARRLGAVGVAWWSMQHAEALPEVWRALSETKGFVETGETTMWKDHAIGLYTKEATWTNNGFDFIIGHAGEGYGEPNANLKPIEERAVSMKQAFLLLWDFQVDFYRRNQYPADESRWPKLDQDWPYQMFTRALAARDYQAVMIRIMNPYNDGGNVEDPAYISFAAAQFVARINGWLEKNRPGVPLVLITCNDFIVKYAPNMNNWAYKYNSCVEQAAVMPLDASFPQATDKVKNYISIRPTLEFWYYYNGSTTDLFLFNGTPEQLAEFLGIGSAVDKILPSKPGNLVGAWTDGKAQLSWSPSTDNVAVAGYGVWRDGIYLAQAITNAYSEIPSAGTHVYEVDAVDAAGNHSARASVVVTVSVETGGDVMAALARIEAEQARQGKILDGLAWLKR